MAQSIAAFVNSCARKKLYRSRSLANRMRREHRKYDDCRRCQTGMRLDVYLCSTCNFYHLGHALLAALKDRA